MYGPKAAIAEALVYSLVLLATLAGCGESPPVDTSLLTGEPCAPPCWQGLVPGVSTEAQILKYISDSDYVGDHYRDTDGRETTIWWQSSLRGRGQDTSNAFGIREGILTGMVIYLDYEFTLDQLLARYGPPEKLWTQWSAGGSAVALVNLYYPTEGIIPQLELEPSKGYHELRADDTITRVWYFPSTTLDELPTLGASVPCPPRQYMDTDLRDWEGYGRIHVR